MNPSDPFNEMARIALLGARSAIAVGEMGALLYRLIHECKDDELATWAFEQWRQINERMKQAASDFDCAEPRRTQLPMGRA